MTKPKTSFKSKKRNKPFSGTHISVARKLVMSLPSVESTPSTSSENRTPSSSSKKLGNQNKFESFMSNHAYDLVDVGELSKALNSTVDCKKCGGEITLSVCLRNGLASTIKIVCQNCQVLNKLRNSKKLDYELEGKSVKLDTINIRFTYALRCTGKGFAGAKLLCAMMNIPPPQSKHFLHQNVIRSALEVVGKDIMVAAVEEACISNSGNRDLAISLDGSWQKRGHTSLNGVVSAASTDSGKIVDIVVLSKHCRCPLKFQNTHNENCIANHSGTSGAMEAAGAEQIFLRSMDKYNVRYSHYLGDGDSKGFLKVVEQNPYGDSLLVQKLECIGHVQKRMGSRLRKLKTSYTSKKLQDGKPIGGKGRLTDVAINDIQKFYGLAIRRNVGSLAEMKKAVWAEFFHLGSNDQNPAHNLCSLDWCKFLKAQAEKKLYEHSKHFHLPKVVMEILKPVFRDLANPALLEKCVHGKTQNTNESYNNALWVRCPKNIFVEKSTLELGAYDALCCFNEGNISRCRVLEKLFIDPGKFTIAGLMKEDELRIVKAEKDLQQASKCERQKISRARKSLEEKFKKLEKKEGPSYEAGSF